MVQMLGCKHIQENESNKTENVKMTEWSSGQYTKRWD